MNRVDAYRTKLDLAKSLMGEAFVTEKKTALLQIFEETHGEGSGFEQFLLSVDKDLTKKQIHVLHQRIYHYALRSEAAGLLFQEHVNHADQTKEDFEERIEEANTRDEFKIVSLSAGKTLTYTYSDMEKLSTLASIERVIAMLLATEKGDFRHLVQDICTKLKIREKTTLISRDEIRQIIDEFLDNVGRPALETDLDPQLPS